MRNGLDGGGEHFGDAERVGVAGLSFDVHAPSSRRGRAHSRSACCARSGPNVRTVTSPPCASFRRIASSSANSSYGETMNFSPASSILRAAGGDLDARLGIGNVADADDGVQGEPPVRCAKCEGASVKARNSRQSKRHALRKRVSDDTANSPNKAARRRTAMPLSSRPHESGRQSGTRTASRSARSPTSSAPDGNGNGNGNGNGRNGTATAARPRRPRRRTPRISTTSSR